MIGENFDDYIKDIKPEYEPETYINELNEKHVYADNELDKLFVLPSSYRKTLIKNYVPLVTDRTIPTVSLDVICN